MTEVSSKAPRFTHIFVNSPIDGRLYREIMRKIKSEHRIGTAVLTLVTYGGMANDAYRIGRLLQMTFRDKLYVHVPTVCASAGTLLVCAGHEVIISPISELGPLDAQILKSDELHARRSGLVVSSLFENLGQQAFELHTNLVENIIEHSSGAIKYRTAAHVAGEMVVGLMKGLYDQINPEQIGEDYRFLKIAQEYGKRLAGETKNIDGECLRRLVYDFPSHDFIIDFREATSLFRRVAVPSSVLMGAIENLRLRPVLRASDRVVSVEVVEGTPIYDGTKDDDTDDTDEPKGSNHGDDEANGSGSPPDGSDEPPLDEPHPGGADA